MSEEAIKDIDVLYLIKCHDVEELATLKKIGEPGFPYVPLWADEEIKKQTNFPKYVYVKPSDIGLLLFDCAETIDNNMTSQNSVLIIPLKELKEKTINLK